jgi:hypothetical protein
MSYDDWGWTEEQIKEEPKAFGVLPPGRHSVQITSAKYDQAKYVPAKWAESNPEGWRVSLTLKIHAGGRKYVVFADVPRHWKWMVDRVCAATNTKADSGPDAWASSLVGCHCDVETTVFAGKSGDRGQVAEWYAPEPSDAPEPEPAPARKAPARTPHQKAKAATAAAGLPPDDDIPF